MFSRYVDKNPHSNIYNGINPGLQSIPSPKVNIICPTRYGESNYGVIKNSAFQKMTQTEPECLEGLYFSLGVF